MFIGVLGLSPNANPGYPPPGGGGERIAMAFFALLAVVLLAFFFTQPRGETHSGAPHENRTQTEKVREVTERFNTTRQRVATSPPSVSDARPSPEGDVQ